MDKALTYAGTGVDYDAMDPFKRMAQMAALETDHNLSRFGFSAVSWTRGESVFLIKTLWGYLGLVVEGLGTKSLVADALYKLASTMESLTGRSFYDNVAQCNAAMAFNDLITLGAVPVVYGQYLAVGDSKWFDDEKRSRDLIEGTKKACELAGCVWGGGETPTLKGIIIPGTADLAGATVGIITWEDQLINPSNIEHGDAIVFIESSGIHANGLTLARKIADKLPEGYLTKLSDGRTYGETLLDPTRIYVRLVEKCLDRNIDIHYAVNITGHGWRKLMRATQPFAYVIEQLPRELLIFDFIQEHGPVDDQESYGNLNMGAGFALYVANVDADEVTNIAKNLGLGALYAGYIENSKEKKVVIKPKGLEYSGAMLGVR
ncbi:MAG TPA: AIR synthase-related protein [Candidatus Paceibacterota bacterium]|nr:AIR synthase-related protein [Candidatus Paceibacterota bacterium]